MAEYEQLQFVTGGGEFIDAGELAAVKKFLSLCARGPAAEIRRAIEGGANVLCTDELGRTPLMAASQFNDVASVRELLLAGGDVNAGDGSGLTALMLASRQGSAAVVAALVDSGADVAARDTLGRSALMHAASQARDGVVVDVLLRSGARLDAADKTGLTALMYAVMQSSPDERVVRILLLAGADPNACAGEWTPLRLAISYNRNSAVAKLLLGAGAKRPTGDEILRYSGSLQQNALMPEREKNALAEQLFRAHA